MLKLTLIFISCFGFSAQGASLDGAIRSDIKKFGYKGSELGLFVEDLSSGNVLFEHNADSSMVPASITKTVMAGAILDAFDPGFQFETELWVKGKVSDGVLKGSLYLKGNGDPSFVSERMWFLVNEFLRAGIKKIDGPIIVDDTLFDRVTIDPGRSNGRVDRAYDAPVSALSFNWNSVNVFVRPGQRVGAAAQVYLDPMNTFVKLKNKATTLAKGNPLTVKAERQVRNETDYVTVTGGIPLGRDEKVFYKNISRPSLWSGNNLKEFLRQRDIEVTGNISRGKVPSGARKVSSAPGATVQELVTMMMKFSNNFIAETMSKNLSIAGGARQGTFGLGLEAVKKHMAQMGVNAGDLKILSVSGLSRENKFKPRAMGQLIRSYMNNFEIGPEYISSLPVAGFDGTLKDRMKGTPAEGRVRAKTGLLTGVAALAGIAHTKSGDTRVFVFLYNGKKGVWKVRDFFDRLAVHLVTKN